MADVAETVTSVSSIPGGAGTLYGVLGTFVAGVLLLVGKRLENGDAKHAAEVKGYVDQIKAYQDSNAQLHQKVGELMGEMRGYAADVARLEEKVNAITQQNVELRAGNEKMHTMLLDYETTNITLMEKVQTLEADNRHLTADNHKLATENKAFRAAYARAKARRDAAAQAKTDETQGSPPPAKETKP
jgi:outer membrane murein-binding lipoprotein Lpp